MDRTSDAAVTYLCCSSAQHSLFSALFPLNGSIFCVLNCPMSCSWGRGQSASLLSNRALRFSWTCCYCYRHWSVELKL